MSGAPAVSCRGLGFTYPDGTRALVGITLDIAAGSSVAIIGANGAGKSTLALLTVGVIFPTEGSLAVFGLEVSPRTVRATRRRVGLVFQNPDDQLFMPSVLEDAAFGPLNMGLAPAAARAAAEEALATVGAAGLKDRFPGHLSEGEKRAAALASILSMRPDLLVLDEPTSGLDPRSRRQVIRQLASLPQTKVIVSHDLEMVLDLCPRAVLLDSGEIVADGPSLELLADERLVEEHGLEVPCSLGPADRPELSLPNGPHAGGQRRCY